MFSMLTVCQTLHYLFGGEAPSRHAIICAMPRRSTQYGYPAIHRAIAHGYAEYGADGRAVVLTEKGREYADS